jgi:hypothetical protein
MKRFLMTLGLACVLSSSAFAGEIPCDVHSPAPLNGTTQTTNPTAPGDIPCGFAEQISEAALSGLLTVVGLVA